jgi:hypothetical protein
VVPQAYLRIFQPLEAFSADERAHWERYIVAGGPLRIPTPVYRQRMAVGRLGLLAPTDENDADVRLSEGAYYICPWRTRIRVLASLLSLRETSVPEMADALVPEADARKAARELARLKRRDPSAVPFILQSAWHIPIRWFLLFKDSERRLIELDDGRFSLKYETTVGKARRRVDWALVAVRKAELEPLLELLEELQRWLASFDRRSILELDYASLSRLFTWDELDDDHSASEALEAIEALEGGELSRSADVYQQVAGRWAEIRAHESLN